MGLSLLCILECVGLLISTWLLIVSWLPTVRSCAFFFFFDLQYSDSTRLKVEYLHVQYKVKLKREKERSEYKMFVRIKAQAVDGFWRNACLGYKLLHQVLKPGIIFFPFEFLGFVETKYFLKFFVSFFPLFRLSSRRASCYYHCYFLATLALPAAIWRRNSKSFTSYVEHFLCERRKKRSQSKK